MDYWIRPRKTKISIAVRDRDSGSNSSLKHPTLRTINEQLRNQSITYNAALKMAQELLESLRPKSIRIFHDDNRRVFEEYWEEIMELRELRDPVSARNRLARGINALGNVSIHVATKAEIITVLREAPSRKEATAVINQFLKYLNRPFSLPAIRRKPLTVTYLTWPQFERAVRHIEDPRVRTLLTVLFCTGCRVGEAFALDRTVDKAGRIIFVRQQMTRKFKPAELKNSNSVPERRAVVLSQGIAAVREWIKLDRTDKIAIRNLRFSDLLRNACEASGVPPIAAKDLRHCYAVHWASKGIGIGHIARLLGNSEAVCNKYYTGFVLTDPAVESLLALDA